MALLDKEFKTEITTDTWLIKTGVVDDSTQRLLLFFIIKTFI